MSDELIRRGIQLALASNSLPLNQTEILNLIELCYANLPFEIEKALAISLYHLPQDEDKFLELHGKQQFMHVESQEYGWRISVFLDTDENFFEQSVMRLPPHLTNLMRLAKRLNCRWLLLDTDAAEIPGYPAFDWD